MADNVSVAQKSARSLIGKVVSDKMNKTIVVMVQRRVKHPLYGKYMTKSTKLKVHDAEELAKEGDTVSIQESKPISKLKTWTLSKVLETAPA